MKKKLDNSALLKQTASSSNESAQSEKEEKQYESGLHPHPEPQIAQNPQLRLTQTQVEVIQSQNVSFQSFWIGFLCGFFLNIFGILLAIRPCEIQKKMFTAGWILGMTLINSLFLFFSQI